MEDLEDSPNFQSFSPHVFWGSKQGDCRFFGTLSIGQGRIAGEKKKCKTGRRFSRFAAKIRGWGGAATGRRRGAPVARDRSAGEFLGGLSFAPPAQGTVAHKGVVSSAVLISAARKSVPPSCLRSLCALSRRGVTAVSYLLLLCSFSAAAFHYFFARRLQRQMIHKIQFSRATTRADGGK
jgi:hypothetical protein